VDRARQLFNLLNPLYTDELDVYKYFLKWLVGMVRTAQGRREYNELILLLVGGEGVGKTTFFKLFLPEALARYVVDQSKDLLDTKDARLNMTSNLVMVVDEAGSVTAVQFSTMNEMATKSKIDERALYGKHTETHPRHCSIGATSNTPSFIRSPHGSRRYTAVHIGAPVDRAALIALDKDQLFAQLFALANSDFSQYLTHEEVTALSDYNLNHCTIPEDTLTFELFRPVRQGEAGRWFSLSVIFEKIVHRAAYRDLSIEMLELVLKRRGIPLRQTPVGMRYYLVLKDGCELEREQMWNPYNEA
jgi:predicted P-loop ATPase